MKLIITISILFLTLQIQSQWVTNSSGVSVNLKQVIFYNQNTGWVVGDGGTILKTTNAGINWASMSSGTTQDLYSVTYRDSLIIVVCGSGGAILRSTNGGSVWLPAVSGTTSTLRSVAAYYFTNEFKAVGDNGVILSSTNSGLTWSSEVSNTTSQLNFVIYFSNVQSGYSAEAMGNNGTKLIKPSDSWITDAGFTVTSENLLAGAGASRFQVGGGSLAFMCSESGMIYKRRFGGGGGMIPWVQVNSGVSTPLRSINEGNVSRGAYGNLGKYLWAVGDNGVIRYSADTGSTWQGQTSGVGVTLNSVFMIDSLRGCIVGGGGTILQTNNGGVIGIQQISSNVPEDFSLSQNYPNPFNPVTNIEFMVSKSSFVKLAVFDVSGREVETLVNQSMSAGSYKADWNATKYSSGIYFYSITTENYHETKKMILIK
jgi:photosystem II stability/assembly factor-like uncharacterized protein